MVLCPRGEFIAGVSHKPGIGHVLVIGRGGTDVEELNDFVTLLLPASAVQIKNSLVGLRITQRLQLTGDEIAALSSTIYSIAQIAYCKRHELVELDVNPILLDITGRVTAVDAYVRISD